MHTVELELPSGFHKELFQLSDSSIYVPQGDTYTSWSKIVASYKIKTREEKSNELLLPEISNISFIKLEFILEL